MPSTNHDRPAGVAECFQRSEHCVSSSSSEIRAVLKSEPTRASFSDNSDCFEEEAAALAFDAFAFGVGAGNVLAGWASDDCVGEISEIGNNSICREGSNVIVEHHARVIHGIECTAPIDELTCSDCLKSGPVEAERPATSGRAEKVENSHAALAILNR